MSVKRETTASVTDEERRALLTALDRGYFEVPRRTTLVEVADELDVPDAEASRLLRRAMGKVFRANREVFEAEGRRDTREA